MFYKFIKLSSVYLVFGQPKIGSWFRVTHFLNLDLLLDNTYMHLFRHIY